AIRGESRLALFGASLLSPRIASTLARPIVDLGNHLITATGGGRAFGGGGRRLRLARHLARLFVEEGHIVETIAHGA
ncbi:hypothetical protein ELH72_15390, partial [Rhizobium ruizarguesonis]|uniref:hypothetical protein n=1 Tax=Rhizobium ruizarguesonis TaxID=2081791 RepID=UPI00103155E3